MSVTWSWDLESYISGAWTSIKRDVEIKKTPLVCERGIQGSDITNRVAVPGSLSCSLDNGESNSAGLLGYYSPEHANMRANFGRETPVRLKITYGGTDYYKWRGYISDLQPSVGRFGERSSVLSAVDYMQKLMEHKLNLLAVQENKRSDQLVDIVLDGVPDQPASISLETDKFTLPYALTDERDERSTALSVIQKICQSVLGYFFVGENETVIFEREESRVQRASTATLTDTMSVMRQSRNTERIKNRIVGIVHPIRVDADATTLLYELDNPISIPAATTITVNFPFKDPANQAQRMSAKNVVTPFVADAHYRMSAIQGGTGNDLNASLTVTPTVGANQVKAALENTGGVTGFVNMINIFGQGIYYYSPYEVVIESGDADKSATYDFYYLSDIHRARSFLVALHDRTAVETTDVESVEFYADADATLMGYAMNNDIGDCVTLVETATGINGQYTINRVKYSIEPNGTLRVEWGLERTPAQTYFVLNSSLLDGAHVLSPY